MKIILVLLTAFALVGTSLAQSQRRILDTEHHIVTVAKKGKSVIFTMEAIGDLTEDRDSSQPLGRGWDFAGIRVDINNNNVVDEHVDIAFGTRQKTNIFCGQYIIRENASTGCGVLPSKGSVQVEFKGTSLQEAPHPVFVYQIPLAELARGGGKIGLVFSFGDPATGRFSYPSRRSPLSFRETIQLDLSEL